MCIQSLFKHLDDIFQISQDDLPTLISDPNQNSKLTENPESPKEDRYTTHPCKIRSTHKHEKVNN